MPLSNGERSSKTHVFCGGRISWCDFYATLRVQPVKTGFFYLSLMRDSVIERAAWVMISLPRSSEAAILIPSRFAAVSDSVNKGNKSRRGMTAVGIIEVEPFKCRAPVSQHLHQISLFNMRLSH